MSTTRSELFTTLDNLGIAHETYDHAPVFTVEESTAIKAKIAGGHSKNLFLKDKSGAFFLICAQSDTPIKINKLHPVLNCKRLSFGKPDALLEKLGVTPGSVTLFSIINDVDGDVTLIIDQRLTEHERVNFHPLLNDATTAITSQDRIKLAKATGHDPIVLDFVALSEG